MCSADIRMYFRGGSAIDKLVDWKATVSLHLFQRGFSLGSDMSNWHEYDRHSEVEHHQVSSDCSPKLSFSHF